MLKANIQAQIEQKTQQLNQVKIDICKLLKVIGGLKMQLEKLIGDQEDLEYEIEVLKEKLEDE